MDNLLLFKKLSISTTRSIAMNKQVVLITGALTGIGRAAAVAFAKKGAKVVVLNVDGGHSAN